MTLKLGVLMEWMFNLVEKNRPNEIVDLIKELNNNSFNIF